MSGLGWSGIALLAAILIVAVFSLDVAWLIAGGLAWLSEQYFAFKEKRARRAWLRSLASMRSR